MLKRKELLLLVVLAALTLTAIQTNQTAQANPNLLLAHPEITVSPNFSNNSILCIQNVSSTVEFNYAINISFRNLLREQIKSIRLEFYIDDNLEGYRPLKKAEVDNFVYSFRTNVSEGLHSMEAIGVIQYTYSFSPRVWYENSSSGKSFIRIEKLMEPTPAPPVSPFLLVDTVSALAVAIACVVGIVLVALLGLYFKKRKKEFTQQLSP